MRARWRGRDERLDSAEPISEKIFALKSTARLAHELLVPRTGCAVRRTRGRGCVLKDSLETLIAVREGKLVSARWPRASSFPDLAPGRAVRIKERRIGEGE